MKLFILLLMLSFSCAYSQRSFPALAPPGTFTIKFCPLALADDVSFPTIQMGIEYKFSQKISWYNEFGIKYRIPGYEKTDSIFINSKGWKAKTEFRYYLQQKRRLKFASAYVGMNVFATNNQYNTEIGYYLNMDSTTITKDGFGVKKSIFGVNGIFGFQKNYSKRIAVDIYGGVGIRCRNISTSHKEFDVSRDSYSILSADVNAADLRNRADANAGYSVLPNLTLGIRVCYRLK